MSDFVYGVQKVNGAAGADQGLTQGLDFWTITTAVNILTAGTTGGSAASQAALNKLIEIISLNGQPVILNNPTVASTVYTLTFAIEHPGSWATGAAMVAAIQAAGVNFGFSTDNTITATLTSELAAQ
jgi:hypothetical protein